jgi:LPXTG-motif cell wall-anchored protein
VAASLVVALAPGLAAAQTGAGDDQYQDPFSGESQPAPKPKPKKAQPTPAQPVPHQQVPSQQQAGAQPTAPSQQPTAASGELPRTGLDLAPLVLIGIALVAAGLVLRRRAGHGSD